MISTKRQIKRDDDRYGGFGVDITAAASDYNRIDDIAASPDYSGGDSLTMSDTEIDIRNNAPSAYEEQLYSTLDTAAAPEVTDLPARPKKKTSAHTSEDILPTLKTRMHATNSAESEAEEEEAKERVSAARREHRGLSSREKVLLCVYVVVALILAVAVIATGVSISRATVEADAFAERIAQKQVRIAEQETTLAVLRDEDNIRGRAMENGMVQAGEPEYNAPLAETTEYPEAEPRTNPFDQFLDWFQNVID